MTLPSHPVDTRRLCYVLTVPASVRVLMRGHLAHLQSKGFDVTAISSPGSDLDLVGEREGVRTIGISMWRAISPLHDLMALAKLTLALRRLRPHIVNASTPKAGLLGMLAAVLTRVPIRIYTLRGLRLETTRGLRRQILALTERVASACAHRVICISRSLADEYVRLGLADPAKVVVLGAGSSNGIDAGRFDLGVGRTSINERIREQFGIAAAAPIIGYVGRFARDKGTDDLVAAFCRLRHSVPQARLLLVGEEDPTDPPLAATMETIRTDKHIIATGHVGDTAAYYQAMNVFAFPSYREGFGNAVIEAQAAGLPVVAFRATGVVDALVDGETGRLVPAGNADALADAIVDYLRDANLASAHGESGRMRVHREFTNERVWQALVAEYERLIESKATTQLNYSTLPSPAAAA